MSSSIPKLFDVPLEGGTASDVLTAIISSQSRPFWIVTANPEILLAAQEDTKYREAIGVASWRTIDGFGLQLVLTLGGFNPVRLTGVDLGEALIADAAAKHLRVAFFGGFNDCAQRAVDYWKARYLGLDIQAVPIGLIREDGFEDPTAKAQLAQLMALKPDYLFVALGGGKKQELWIARHLADFSQTKVIVGVGGAFDMWSGALRRAPKYVRMIGLEWLWRLILEPRRWRRIWRAVFVFLYRSFREA